MRTHLLNILVVLVSLYIFSSTNEANMKTEQLQKFLKSSKFSNSNFDSLQLSLFDSSLENCTSSSVYVEDQAGLMENDKISSLPGQPKVDFAQYGGYVYLDSKHEEALFYYLVESSQNSSTKPLLLWLNGGPGCSSLGFGAMMELGPFRVNSDGKTLHKNPYSWISVANLLFLESPAGVGYSYTKAWESGDVAAAKGNFVFLVNWFERFPQYKGRDFFIAGESYSGHYIPQLASLILHHNNIANDTKFNLRGIMEISDSNNSIIMWYTTYKDSDVQINEETSYEYMWSHALISNKVYDEIKKKCNFSAADSNCANATSKATIGNIDQYNIYAPICASDSNKSDAGMSDFDPCSESYVGDYLNDVAVKEAFHASKESQWKNCRTISWRDMVPSMHDALKQLIFDGLTIWLYSGDVDSIVPVTSTRRSILQLGLPITKDWYPWYNGTEVGGFAVQHKGLVLVTVRGAGHMVPSDKPQRALALISSFLQAKLPPDTPS